MSNLSAPWIMGPITPCSRAIRVTNQFPGSSVRIFAGADEVAYGQAASPDVMIELHATKALATGAEISAEQIYRGQVSERTPRTVKVLAAPTAEMLGKLYTLAPLLECSTCLWLGGVVPRAAVSVQVNQRPPIIVTADWPVVHVDLPDPLYATDTVRVSQTACGIAGPTVKLPPVLTQPWTGSSPHAPTLDGPLRACQSGLQLRNVLPGATVLIGRGGAEMPFCFGRTEAVLWLGDPLVLGEVVTTRQEYSSGRCRLIGEPHKTQVTEEAPPAPHFTHRVCAGDIFAEVSGLVPGAVVHIFRDSDPEPLVTACASMATCIINFPLGWEAMRLYVRQTLCADGPWSPKGMSRVVPQGQPVHATVVQPLVECGTAVAVEGLRRGTFVSVVSKLWQGEIGYAMASGDRFENVPVWPALVRDDELRLETIRCGLLRSGKESARVGHAPQALGAPHLDNPSDDVGGLIWVREIVPGATVDIETVDTEDWDPAGTGVLIASQPATRGEAAIAVPPLPLGTLIRARQRLCSMQSRVSGVAKIADRWLEYRLDDTPPGEPQRGSTVRICQLTGPADPGNRPHPFNTRDIDLKGTDLGIPVIHKGVLFLFFGDSDRGETQAEYADPIAWTDDAPEPGDVGTPWVPTLYWITGHDGDDDVFRRLAVDRLPSMGVWEVPTGGFSYEGRLYLFVAREGTKTAYEHGRLVDPGGMNTSHLAVSQPPNHDATQNFDLLYDVSTTMVGETAPAGRWLVHVSPVVIRNADWPGLPSDHGDGVLFFGTEKYHWSDVYLAWAPLTPGKPPPHPSTWKFYTNTFGNPWLTLAEAQAQTQLYNANVGQPLPIRIRPQPLLNIEIIGRPPTGGQYVDLANPPEPHHGLGELSVTWSPHAKRWLMAYHGASLRVARYPWGPWSPLQVIFDGNDPLRAADNIDPPPDGRRYVGLPHEDDTEERNTVAYAPYVIPSWTHFDRSTRITTIYYTLSTEHPPYQVQLMSSQLKCR